VTSIEVIGPVSNNLPKIINSESGRAYCTRVFDRNEIYVVKNKSLRFWPVGSHDFATVVDAINICDVSAWVVD
jgi:hypothetical protein